MDILARRLTLASVLAALAAASALAAGPIRLIPSGSVDVRAGAGTQWRPVAGEETVSAGMEVRTHRNATAQLRFEDGSVVQIGNYSIFAVDKTDTQETSFSLKLGKIRAAFAGLLSSRVNIRTPTAVCAVRGTVFDIGLDGKDTQVRMAEGVLEVKDNNGKQAVVTSEESIKIGEHGMERPHIIPLNDPGALGAVRPYQVHQEMGRDSTRRMLEDLRNRELKSNEAQLGKDVVDAYGRRVRLEEYLLRPDTKSFEVLFISKRSDRFDWGHFVETFQAPIPDDLSQVPAIVQGAILAANQPSNWLKTFEFYATNTIDADKEKIVFGDPVQVNFAGFGKGLLWYPSSIDFTQTLSGPGVPGGSRDQFVQHQDWNTSNAGMFTWSQSVQPNATSIGAPTSMFVAVLDPTSSVDVANGLTGLVSGGPGNAVYDNTNTVTTYPGGPSKANFQQVTTYWDGTAAAPTTVSVQKFLVSNDGTILDFANPTASAFTKEGNYNLEINIKSSLFGSRDIDVLVAPEILHQKSRDTGTGNNIVQP